MPPLVLPTPPPQTPLPPHMPMGRIFAPDRRDGLFRARSMQPAALGVPVVRRNYRAFFPPRAADWRSQGSVSSCTEHALTNKLCGWPMPRKIGTLPWQQHALYRLAQTMDEWPGEDYEGTSGRGVCRAARQFGLISEWWNAFTVDEVLDLLLADSTNWQAYGPVIIGTNWYSSMDRPNAKGLLEITPNARVLGGHETCLIGANLRTETLYAVNSWDHMKLFRLSFETFRRLLAEDGDAIFPVETARTLPNA